jgi:hypothetical protein
VDRDSLLDLASAFWPGSWKRAARCGPDGGNCVEVNCSVAGLVAVRDSKLFASPVLAFGNDQWCCFVEAVCTGRYTARGVMVWRSVRGSPRADDLLMLLGDWWGWRSSV